MKRILILLLLFITLSSHELFLKAESYFLREHQKAELFLFNGTFDVSENIITRDRIVSSSITGPDYQFQPEANDYFDKGDVTYLNFKTGKAGTYLAGISTKPRIIELSGEDFTGYLEHEGLTSILEKRKQEGSFNNSAREKYSKHIKAILQVANKTTDHYAKELGYPIEFIPLKNPYDLKVGDQMAFKLLYLGKPIKNQTAHVSSRKSASDTDGEEQALITDENGELSFTITNKGQWYVASIYMEDSKEENLDYESNWATLTFEVR